MLDWPQILWAVSYGLLTMLTAFAAGALGSPHLEPECPGRALAADFRRGACDVTRFAVHPVLPAHKPGFALPRPEICEHRQAASGCNAGFYRKFSAAGSY